MTYFIRAKCTIKGQECERKFRASGLAIANFEQMREWVSTYFRDLELQEYAEWDERTHGGILFKVPRQHVRFDAPAPELITPAPRRTSLLVSRIPRKKLLTH